MLVRFALQDIAHLTIPLHYKVKLSISTNEKINKSKFCNSMEYGG